MNSERIRVAVIGAGISGLTVALALARYGLRCHVFEQARLLSEVGAGVQLSPNSTRLLHRFGLRSRLRRTAVRPQAIEMRRWDDNSVLRRTPLGAACEQRFGAPYYTVHRADLHQGLLEHVAPGTLHLGLRCTGLQECRDGVHLQFADGSSTTADLVVGADGIHSRVRDVLVRNEPTYSGHSVYRALIPAERVPFLLTEPKVVLWLGPGQHCVSYPICGGTRISLAATVPDPGWGAESWSARGTPEDLACAYADWAPEVRALTTAPDVVSRWALHDRESLPRWSTGRITVIGDAAHPMLPFFAQGANQAVEDAITLAGCLRDAWCPRGIADALARYETVRAARTGEVHRISRANTTALHLPDGAAQRSRDTALAAHATLEDQEWIYGYDAEAAVTALGAGVAAGMGEDDGHHAQQHG
ncbi:MAG TPA: FAD-dependent oxidoreductase [Pseudonocardiaceae bacterium]